MIKHERKHFDGSDFKAENDEKLFIFDYNAMASGQACDASGSLAYSLPINVVSFIALVVR